MIWDALFSGHPLGIFTGLLQLGAIVFAVVFGIVLWRDERKAEAKAERRAERDAPDLSDVPDLWPER